MRVYDMSNDVLLQVSVLVTGALLFVFGTVIEGMFAPYAHVRMRARKGLASRARVTPASSHALPHSNYRLLAALVAAQVLFAHAVGPCHMDKTYRIGGTVAQHLLLRSRYVTCILSLPSGFL
jgi:hypothetical protein